jgi:lipopolysaccharide export system permease protein
LIRTLHWYISRELLKTAGLALAALTALMTVFAIVEPLRKQGLAPEQVLSLFVYTIPIMLSLTLPIAALFATTIVLGRFSQDNELTACRASGISTVAILRPALVLGIIVTVASLLLSNFITPRMMEKAETVVKANMMSIAARQIKKHGFIQLREHVVHAVDVEEKGDRLALRGMVYARGATSKDKSKEKARREAGDVLLISASMAWAHFSTHHGETYLTVSTINPVVSETGSHGIGQGKSHPWEAFPIPDAYLKESPTWYDWSTLTRTLRDPEKSRNIQRLLSKVSIDVTHELLCREVADAVNAGRNYDSLSQGEVTYSIRAARAELAGDTVHLHSGQGADGLFQKVKVTILQNGQPKRIVEADTGIVQAKWLPISSASFAMIELTGSTMVSRIGAEPDGRRAEKWTIGRLAIPQRITDTVANAGNVYETMSDLATVQKRRHHIEGEIFRLRAEIVAEMNGRMAYSLSCFLLVAMGAGLGVVFRGGQFISAFALSAMPATLMIVMVLMGKEMMTNKDVDPMWGYVSIWGGLVALLVANAFLYARLVRK